jgi:hypothetical protein
MKTKQTITARMLDWVQAENDEGRYPRYTDLDNKYKEISGSVSMSHHLPNWRNENTQRKCTRYLVKIEAFPSKFEGNYMIKYREVHPRLEGLRKLRSRLNNWLYTTRKNGLHEHETFYTVQTHLKSVQANILACNQHTTYMITKDTLLLFNNLYNTYNITKAN